jgi:hypothetical protein
LISTTGLADEKHSVTRPKKSSQGFHFLSQRQVTKYLYLRQAVTRIRRIFGSTYALPFPGWDVHERLTYASVPHRRQLPLLRGSFAVLQEMMTFGVLPFVMS